MRTSAQFYTELNPERLASRKERKHTDSELKYLQNILNKKQKILDLGCGYGRFTIPLAKKGYEIEGIDITPTLISKAKKDSEKKNLRIRFKLGDMRKLPYSDNTFDAIICMWCAFCELYKEKYQIQALKEMLRVLRRGGFAFIEMRYSKGNPKSISQNKEIKKITNKRVMFGEILGIETMPQYLHNKSTLKRLMKKAKINQYNTKLDDFGGRDRLLLQFWK